MSSKTYEPKYQCWVEKDFLADRAVMRMTPTQRHFYRALLQAAFNVDTRPYLPADDNELWQIADADSIEQWQGNKASVLAKFQPFTAGDGTELWSHKRILSDWGQVLDYVEKKRKGGLARQQKSAPAEHDAASACKPKVLKGKEKEIEMETVTEPATAFGTVTDSNWNPLADPLSSPANGSGGTVTALIQKHINGICNMWASLYGKPAEDSDVGNIINRFYDGDAVWAEAEIQNVLIWAKSKSNHWGPDKNNLRSTADLLRDFNEIHRQWCLYMEKVREGDAAKHFMRESRNSTPAPAGIAPAGPGVGVDEEFGSFPIDEDELDD